MGEERNIPAIRFKGFSAEWKEKTLGEVLPITSSARVHKNEWTKSGVPFFRSSDVVANYKGNENEKAFISFELYKELTDKIGRVKQGDILVTGGGSIGIPYLVPSDDPLYFKDADLLWFKADEDIDSRFLYMFFSANPFRRHLKSISHIGTIAHYTVEQAKRTPIGVPDKKEEQSKIGSYFENLDRLITQHQRKHEKLVTLKKAMLIKMFPAPGATTPEIRFKGFSVEWVEKKLGAAGDFNPKAELPEIFEYVDLESVVGTQMVAHRTETRSSAPSRAQRLAQQGDLFYQMVRPYQKNNHLFTIRDGNYVFSTGYAQIRPYGDGHFLLSLVQGEGFVKKVLENCTGTSFPAINSNDLAEILVRIPDPKEQKKIGAYFQQLDELIAQQGAQVEKLKQLKAACLEKMFV